MEFSLVSSSLVATLLLISFGADPTWAASWSYEGKTGPHYWHELFPQKCSGMHQSPINIKVEQTLYDPALKDFALWTDPPKPGSTMTVLNNGHTVQVSTNADLFVANAGLPNIYKTVQFHFHWGDAHHRGSEHLIDDTAFPLELHIVNYNWETYDGIVSAVTEKQGLAVLGVMFQLSDEDNENLEPIIAAMEQVQNPDEQNQVEIEAVSLRNLLPEDMREYFRYNGSLTTPSCFESVIWTVFANPQTISVRQMEKFRDQLQTSPKHGGHKKRSASTQPLPASRQARKRERRALQVLEELGLTAQERARFRRDLVAKKEHAEALAAKMDEENAGETHRHTLEAVHKEVPHHDDGGSSSDSGDEAAHISEVELELLQDRLVNNFRPVQPLNDRLVYRSFKLREEHHHPRHHHHRHHPSPHSSGSSSQHHGAKPHNPDLPDAETIRRRLQTYESVKAGAAARARGGSSAGLLLLPLVMLTSSLAAVFW